MTPEELKKRARLCYRRLKRRHQDATIELNFSNPCELLIATILSAQCTDLRVNIVTEKLFQKYKQPEDYLKRSQEELENDIRTTGFFRQKAKSVRGSMKLIVEQHSGNVPQSMEELMKLPGVGRKTANVVLGNAFDTPGMPVDTHVTRIANRLGLVNSKDAVRIEHELCALIPKKEWTLFSHTLIFHGRRVCKARRPLCEECDVAKLCNSADKGI